MKWFTLMVIFAVALYQGVTGSPTNVLKENMEWHLKNASHDLETEVANKSSLVIPELFKHFPTTSFFIEIVDNWTNTIELMKNVYESLWRFLENLARCVHEFEIQRDQDVTKDKDTEDQSTLENVSVETVRDKLFNSTLLQLRMGKLNYKEAIKSLQDIVKYIQNYIIKDKTVKNELTSEDDLSFLSAYMLVKMEIAKLHKTAMDKNMKKVMDYVTNVKENLDTSIAKKTKGQGMFDNIFNFLNKTISQNPIQEAES